MKLHLCDGCGRVGLEVEIPVTDTGFDLPFSDPQVPKLALKYGIKKEPKLMMWLGCEAQYVPGKVVHTSLFGTSTTEPSWDIWLRRSGRANLLAIYPRK